MYGVRQLFWARFGACWVVQETPVLRKSGILDVPKVPDHSRSACSTVPRVARVRPGAGEQRDQDVGVEDDTSHGASVPEGRGGRSVGSGTRIRT